jgi:hypothetical protein
MSKGQPLAGTLPDGKLMVEENEMVLLENPAVTPNTPEEPLCVKLALTISGFGGRNPAS